MCFNSTKINENIKTRESVCQAVFDVNLCFSHDDVMILWYQMEGRGRNDFLGNLPSVKETISIADTWIGSPKWPSIEFA